MRQVPWTFSTCFDLLQRPNQHISFQKAVRFGFQSTLVSALRSPLSSFDSYCLLILNLWHVLSIRYHYQWICLSPTRSASDSNFHQYVAVVSSAPCYSIVLPWTGRGNQVLHLWALSRLFSMDGCQRGTADPVQTGLHVWISSTSTDRLVQAGKGLSLALPRASPTSQLFLTLDAPALFCRS